VQGTTHLVEPTVVDVTIDDRTWRREETHDAHVQTNVDHQHEQTVNTTERHLLLWAVGYWSERHTTADLYCSLVCQQTFDDWWVFIVRQPARRRSTSVVDHFRSVSSLFSAIRLLFSVSRHQIIVLSLSLVVDNFEHRDRTQTEQQQPRSTLSTRTENGYHLCL